MSMAYQVFQQLRSVRVNDEHKRQIRATFVAQAYAFQCHLELSKSLDDTLEECRPNFRKFLSELNEFVAVDTQLALRLFEAMVRARYEVVSCNHSTVLINHILQSEALADQLNNEMNQTIAAFVGNREYRDTQQRVKDIMIAPVTGE